MSDTADVERKGGRGGKETSVLRRGVDLPQPHAADRVGRIGDLVSLLPPLPMVLVEAAALLDAPDAGVGRVAECLGRDPALAAGVLRLVNSPMFAGGKEHTTLSHAVTTLGFRRLGSLLAAASIDFLRFTYTGEGREDVKRVLDRVWRNSSCTAVGARLLAERAGRPFGEEAFLCGLLHDVGKLALIRTMPLRYATVVEAAEDLADLIDREEAAFGFNHALLGTYVSEKWRFSAEVCGCIRRHHDRLEPPFASREDEIAALVQAADLTAHYLGHGSRAPRPELFESIARLCAPFDLSENEISAVIDEVGSTFEASADGL